MNIVNLLNFYQGKKIFITGHTGFKGSWLCGILLKSGAELCGYSDMEHQLFEECGFKTKMTSVLGDVRDLKSLQETMQSFRPDIVFHLAAQPLVIEGYNNPVYTFDTNVMGTVNLLEAVRNCNSVQSVVNITTDKVYENMEWNWGYRENDKLNGQDPYSNSKSCSELVTSSYIKSFFDKDSSPTAVATARAGNVIGGGDYAENRIIPDCFRQSKQGERIKVRNKSAVRPWQHVTDPLIGYLLLAKELFQENNKYINYNFGPEDKDCISVGELVDIFCQEYDQAKGWDYIPVENSHHESNLLKLDCSLARYDLGWKPLHSVKKAIQLCVEWQHMYEDNIPVQEIMYHQIENIITHQKD